jgi:predicted dehydrogenase
MKVIRYGIVGTGYFGYGLAKILSEIEGALVTAVYDPNNAKSVAELLECDIEDNLESLCQRNDIDAVIVASPNAYHRMPVLEAAKHGKHIFCEKPIALSYTDCKEMIDATKQKGLIFMAGHVMNFMDGVRRVKRTINDGQIGDVLFAHAERTGWEEKQKQISWKKKKRLSGGHLYHHIHELDFIQFIMGPAQRVCMVGGNVAHQGNQFGDEEDLLLISLEFAEKKFATMQYGSAFKWNEHYIKIQGTKGAILIDLQDAKVVLRTSEKEEQFLLHASKEEDEDRTKIYKGLDGGIMYGNPKSSVPLWLNTIMERELQLFHNTIKGGEIESEYQPLLDGSAAKEAIATADALTLSLEEDRKVSVGEIRS